MAATPRQIYLRQNKGNLPMSAPNGVIDESLLRI